MVFCLQAGDDDKDFDSVWTTTEPNLVVQLVQSTSITLNMNPALTRYSNNIFIWIVRCAHDVKWCGDQLILV